MQWFFLYFPHLYGETWHTGFHTEQPLAFTDEKGSYIVDANPAAQRSGVEKQMLINTAFCLAPSMDVEIIRADKAEQALVNIAKRAYRFSAWIGLEPPAGLYLEVATMRRLFGSLTAIREQILNLFQELDYTLKIAAAPAPKAAHLLALSGAEICVDQANLTEALKHISIDCLDTSKRTHARLQKLGLRTVHDLIKLPSGDLAYRVDEKLAEYLRKVTGQQPWQPPPFKLPEQFYRKVDLEQEIENLSALLFPLSATVKKFCQFMQNRCIVSQSLNISLGHPQCQATPLPIHLATADNRADIWLYILSQCTARVKLPAPVNGFTLEASAFEAIPPSSLKLFDNLPGMNNEHIADSEKAKAYLLNRFTGRIGANSIRFMGVTADPRPEHQTAYSLHPFISESRLPEKASSSKKRAGLRRAGLRKASARTLHSQQKTQRRTKNQQSMQQGTDGALKPLAINQPLWLLPQPKPITIQHYRILQGPVRLDTGWWDNQYAQRDYYIGVEQRQDSPALSWLFRTIGKKWFIHGIFS